MSRVPGPGAGGSRVYRALLRLLPRDLRGPYGPEMEAIFLHRLARERSRGARVRLWVLATADVVVQSFLARRRRRWSSVGQGRGGLLIDLHQDLRFASRTLRRSPAFSATVVATLALALGTLAVVGSVVDGVLLRPLNYPRPERLAYLVGSAADVMGPEDLDPAPDAMEPLIRFTIGLGIATGTEGPRRVHLMHVGRGFFDLLGLVPVEGRLFGDGDHGLGALPAAVLSHRFWIQELGGGAVAGRTVTLDGRPFSAIGVLPADFEILRYGNADLWIPWEAGPPQRAMALTRLRAGVSPAEAEARLAPWAARLVVGEAAQRARDRGIPSIRVIDLKEGTIGGVEATLWALLAGAVLLLLVAGANLATLVLGRTAARRRELALRAALGAGRGRLARQLMVELGLVAGVAGLLAVILAAPVTRALLAYAPDRWLPGGADLALGPRALLVTASAGILTVLVFGMLPAAAGVVRARGGLREGRRGTASRREVTLQSTLVVTEIAAALVMVVGAGLLLRTFLALNPTDPGFRVEGLLTASVNFLQGSPSTPPEQARVVDRLLERVQALPSRPRAAAVSSLPLSGNVWSAPVRAVNGEGVEAGSGPSRVYVWTISPGYLDLMEIPLLAGRNLRNSAREILVNESAAARFWPDQSPLGGILRLQLGGEGEDELVVVGVVQDVWSLSPEPRPEVFATFSLASYGGFHVVVESSASRPITPTDLRRALSQVDAGLPLDDVVPFREVVSTRVQWPRFQASTVSALAGIVLVLAATGCFGALAQLVGRRRREMGIRLALGSTPGGLLARVLTRSALLAGGGIALGLVGAWAGTRVIEGSLYGVGRMDPATLLGAAGVLMVTALVAAAAPALQAACVDPVSTLSAED